MGIVVAWRHCPKVFVRLQFVARKSASSRKFLFCFGQNASAANSGCGEEGGADLGKAVESL